MANKKILFWIPGTGVTNEQRLESTPELSRNYKQDGHDITVLMPDGVATDDMTEQMDFLRGESENEERERRKTPLERIQESLLNLVGVSPDILEQFLIGYSEETHLVQVSEFLQGLEDYFKEQSKRVAQGKEMEPFDLIVGGYSRGAAVGVVGFLVSMVSQLQADEQSKEKVNLFTRKLISSMKFIINDPAPGVDFSDNPDVYRDQSQDFMGLSELLDSDEQIPGLDKSNPLKYLIGELAKHTGIPISIDFVPSRFETLKGLEASAMWNALAKDLPKGVSLNTYQAGLNHFAHIRDNENVYKKYAELFGEEQLSPKKLLGMTIEVSLGLRDRKELDIFYKKLRRVETVILAGLLKESARQSEVEAVSTKSVFNIPLISDLIDFALVSFGERKTVYDVESDGDLSLSDDEVMSEDYEQNKANLRVPDSDDTIINGRDVGLSEIQKMMAKIENFQRKNNIPTFEEASKRYVRTDEFLNLDYKPTLREKFNQAREKLRNRLKQVLGLIGVNKRTVVPVSSEEEIDLSSSSSDSEVIEDINDLARLVQPQAERARSVARSVRSARSPEKGTSRRKVSSPQVGGA